MFTHHVEFFNHMETSPLRIKGCKFSPILGTHGHWAVRVFRAPHLLWHASSVYICHLRGPVTFTTVAERLTYVYMTWFCRGWDSNTKPSACDANALTDFVTAAADVGMMIIKYLYIMETCKIPSELCVIGFFRMTNIISHVSWHPRDIDISRYKMYHQLDIKLFRRRQSTQIEIYLRFLLCFLDFCNWYSRVSTSLL